MCYNRQCHIVPPFILEELAKRGNLSCKKTLNDAHRIRDRRTSALNDLLIRKPISGHGDRLIYDSKHSYEQRVKLVRTEGENGVKDQTVNQAYENTGYVRTYFKDTFGLDSIDDKGLDIISNIHYGNDYNNAYWDGDEMTYGDGDGKEFSNFAGAIDVVAHELMHGITQFLGNLEYSGQSGALNEHFSDVFGTIIKQKFLKQTLGEADWLIGDSIVTKDFPGVAIRSMKAPGTANEFDNQPDHMHAYYDGAADNQGVHMNSGIPNKAFYLACLEIGLDDCALIWFETLKVLWRTADFTDMLKMMLTTAKYLKDKETVHWDAPAAITRSFLEVGLTLDVV